MSVDMFEKNFKKKLRKLPEFHPNDTRNREVWAANFPSWRALFTALTLHGHSTGYQLFSFEKFFSLCKKAYTEDHLESYKYKNYFQGDLYDGMRQRVGAWYESGMAETYLCACLVEALEDEPQTGMVMYDPRVDWKLKSDVVVHMNGHTMRINAYFGPSESRPQIERRREINEREQKKNTLKSSHLENIAFKEMRSFEIQATKEDQQQVNGFRLFSIKAVNELLEQLYSHAGVSRERWKLIGGHTGVAVI